MLSNMSFTELIHSSSKACPDKTVIVVEGRSTTFGDLDQQSEQYAAMLLRMGLKPGEHVALWGYRSELWIAAFFGIIRAGGTAVLFNYNLTYDELIEQFRLSDIRYIFYAKNRFLEEQPDAIGGFCQELGLPAEAAVNLQTETPHVVSLTELNMLNQLQNEEDVRRTAVIIFTTGTTSEPRAVMLSQFSIMNNVILQKKIDHMEEERSICLALPLFHSFGLAMLLLHILNHSTIYLPERLKVEPILDCISHYAVTDIASVASIYHAIFASPNFATKFSPFIWHCAIGGSHIPPDLLIEMEKSCMHAEFHNGYGLSECSPYVSLPVYGDSLDRRAHTVGQPLPMTQVQIHGKDGKNLSAGQIGEIVVRGFNVMNGYYHVPKDQQPFDAKGWLHTGDLGKLDSDGYLYVLGRLKDLIIRCGENISPSEVESVILKVPCIQEAKVLGIPDPETGEKIIACIVLKPGSSFNNSEYKAILENHLSPYKVPSQVVLFDSFPYFTNGKLDQKKLEELLKYRLASNTSQVI